MATQTVRYSGSTIEQRRELAAPESDDLPGELRAQIDARLRHFLSEHGHPRDPLTAAMCHAALGSGKRMRPLLLMLVGHDLGSTSPALLDAACAVELVHAASLILDDLPCMDDARLRRGQPTVHVQFGENVAILASVALLSRAFQIVAQAEGASPAVRARLSSALAETVGTQGLVRGQFLDLHGGQGRSAEDIAVTNQLKTGVLLGVSVEMAAIIAQADAHVLHALRAFAMAAGHAFQIKDDLLDLPGNDSAVTGKDVGKDAGKATLGSMLGAERCRGRLAEHLRMADGHLTDAIGSKQRTRRLVGSLFRGSGAPAAALAP